MPKRIVGYYVNAEGKEVPIHAEDGPPVLKVPVKKRNVSKLPPAGKIPSLSKIPKLNDTSEDTRSQLLRLQGGLCFYCECRLTYHEVTIDHYHPRSKGGSNKRCNKVAACNRCNAEKRNMPPAAFFNRIGKPLKRPPLA